MSCKSIPPGVDDRGAVRQQGSSRLHNSLRRTGIALVRKRLRSHYHWSRNVPGTFSSVRDIRVRIRAVVPGEVCRWLMLPTSVRREKQAQSALHWPRGLSLRPILQKICIPVLQAVTGKHNNWTSWCSPRNDFL